MFRALIVTISLLLLTACAGKVAVPPVAVQTPIGITPIPGAYAATVQTGGWALDTKPQGWTCSAWSFDTDVNAAYEQAMRDVLTRSLEKTTFVTETLSPEDLKRDGYDAQIILYQGNAASDFSVATGLFTGFARSEVALTVTLAILDEKDLAYQQAITGKGSGQREVFTCNTIGEAIGKAAQGAVQELVTDSALYVRDGLRERLIKKAAGTL